jgi:hypothetical protein
VERVEFAADEQHAIFAIHLVRPATVEIRDDEQFEPRQRVAYRVERQRRRYPRKVIAGMMPGRPQQERKREAALGQFIDVDRAAR